MATLANKVFKSQAELTRHIKAMITNGDLDVPLITELLRFHPNVDGDFDVFIRNHPIYKQKEIAIKYKNGQVPTTPALVAARQSLFFQKSPRGMIALQGEGQFAHGLTSNTQKRFYPRQACHTQRLDST